MSAFKSKTMWFSMALAALSVVQGYISALPLSPTEQMYVGLVVAAAIAGLRYVTTEPLSSK